MYKWLSEMSVKMVVRNDESKLLSEMSVETVQPSGCNIQMYSYIQ